MKRGLAARFLLAAMGGLAAMVAGAGGHYHADYQTSKKKRSNRGRVGPGTYGRTLINHFDGVGICWSAKKNYIAKAHKRAASRA